MNNILTYINRNRFVFIGLCFVGLWYILCLLFPPTINIVAETSLYSRPIARLSLLALIVPIVIFAYDTRTDKVPIAERLLWLACAMLLAVVVHNVRTLLDVELLFLVMVVVYIIKNKGKTFHSLSALHYLLIAYVIWNGISVTWSNNPSYGLHLLQRFVPLILFPICFQCFRVSNRIFHLLLKVFWQAAFIACLLSFCCSIYVLLYLDTSILDIFTLHKAQIHGYYCYNILYAWSATPHPSYNAIWLLFATLTNIYLFEYKQISQTEYTIHWIVTILLVILMQSRIGIVMEVIAFICWITYHFRFQKVALALFSILILAILLVGYLFSPQLFEQLLSDPTREKLLEVAAYHIKLHPWLGCGLGGMTSEYLCATIPNFPFGQYAHFYPHNQFSGDWMQSGLPGMLLITSISIVFLIISIKKRNCPMIAFWLCIIPFMLIEMPLRFLYGNLSIAIMTSFWLTQMPTSDTITSRSSSDAPMKTI